MPSTSWNFNRPIAVLWYHTNYLNSADDSSYYALGVAASAAGAKTWVRTANWKQVLKGGDLPMNPYSFYKVHAATGGDNSVRVTRVDDGKVTYDIEDGNRGSDWDPYTSNTDPLESERAENIARNKVLNEVKHQTVNLGQVYGERHQTVLLFETTMRRVVKTVYYLRKGNWNAAAHEVGVKPSANKHSAYSRRFGKNPSKAVADGWLELQYGWRPLLQDVYGAIELVNDKQNRVIRQRVSKSASVEDTWGSRLDDDDLYKTVNTQKRKTSVKFTLYFSASQEFLKTLSEAGVTNPGLVAWELLPWSFVVDWFLPVGQFISTWDATVGLTYQKGVKTTCKEVTRSTTRSGHTKVSDGGKVTTVARSSLWRTYHYVGIERSPFNGGFPSPALPEFKNPFSAEHLANLTGLLVSTFGRR